MAITIRGKAGNQLARLQQDFVAARRQVRDAERAFETAKGQVTELDTRLAQLEGRRMANERVEGEIKETTKLLRTARERSSDEAQREVTVLRAHLEAREHTVTKFIRENAAEVERSLRTEAKEIVAEAEDHLSAALATKERWMGVDQSFNELLLVTTGSTVALPSADGAASYYRDLKGMAGNALRVPAPVVEGKEDKVAA
jgi:chromosome segregation ATPase